MLYIENINREPNDYRILLKNEGCIIFTIYYTTYIFKIYLSISDCYLINFFESVSVLHIQRRIARFVSYIRRICKVPTRHETAMFYNNDIE